MIPQILHEQCGMQVHFDICDDGTTARIVWVCPYHGRVPMIALEVVCDDDA